VGSAELMLDELPPESALREDVANILQSGQRAAAIIQDLLTLARKGMAASEAIDLNDLIARRLKAPDFQKFQSLHPAVRIHLHREPDLLCLQGSSLQVERSLMNLLLNAAEAMPGGGDLTLETRNRTLADPLPGSADMKPGDYVVLSVSDTGQSLSPEDRSRIFEPFYTKKTLGRSGTGLGLAVVWGTVEAHRGHITLESREGQGNTFTLYFPAAPRGKTVPPRPPLRTDYLGRGETILVVDDVAEQREMALRMLRKLGYRVFGAASGEEAVAWLGDRQAHLLLLDMIMEPGIDGLETYRRALALHPAQKALIVSGFAETERIREAEALGAGGCIRKPYVQEALGAAVRRELDAPDRS
jgi:CheY-like chemotaxis protein